MVEKTKAQLLIEEKARKEEENNKKENTIKGIISEVDKISKSYDARVFEIAIGRWKLSKQENRKAQEELRDAERKLQEVRRKYGLKSSPIQQLNPVEKKE